MERGQQSGGARRREQPAWGRIKLLKQIKEAARGLPSPQDYRIQYEVDYLRRLSSLLPVIGSVRIEELPYLIDEAAFKKIVGQLVRQTQHKEIVAVLLSELVKGVAEYSTIIETTLYDALQFMIEFQRLRVNENLVIDSNAPLELMEKQITTHSVQRLVRQIAKWYFNHKSIAEKYKRLLEKIRP